MFLENLDNNFAYFLLRPISGLTGISDLDRQAAEIIR